MEEVTGSDAKYQGWPLQRAEVIALRQQGRERRNRDAQAFFESLLLDFTTILEAL